MEKFFPVQISSYRQQIISIVKGIKLHVTLLVAALENLVITDIDNDLKSKVLSYKQNPLLFMSSISILHDRPRCRVFKCSQIRCYSSKVDWSNRRPMIRKRIENGAKEYPICDVIPVAKEVLAARTILIQGVSTLMQAIPVQACKFCPEVFVGEQGHSIQTCCGFRRIGKNRVHEWIPGGLSDVLVPVETFRLDHMFQNVIKHDQRLDFDRVNAVVELCRQAGADLNNVNDCHNVVGSDRVECLSLKQIRLTAKWTLKAWETVRSGVKRFLLVYPAKKCMHCSEVHVGPSGHMARLCGIFKYESWSGTHYWKKASVDDLVPLKMVWCRRPHDPPILLNKHRDFYGHAPAVVDLCSKAGIVVPKKYNCMMKLQGISAPLMS